MYIQNYIVENYILIAMVFGMYFVVAMKSAANIFLKRRIVLIMTLLLILSIAEFYRNYLLEQSEDGIMLMITAIIYASLRPLILAIVVNIAEPRRIFMWIPAVANAVIYTCAVFSNHVFYFAQNEQLRIGMMNYSAIVTDWIYWVIFLFILNVRMYKKSEENLLGIFFCISWLITANIMETMGVKAGILNETYGVAFLFYYLVFHVQVSQRVSEEKELKLREQRVSLMLSQIQPHFLYNTLNTITGLCRANPKLAEETTVKFSKYLRENMHDMGKNDMQPFMRELEHTNIYLDIERLRFGERVKVVYDIQTSDFNMPSLTLQPIVENAVKHGICRKVEGGWVKISTEKNGRDYIITIEDDGIGFELSKALNDGKQHVGLQNVRERLKTMIGARLEIESYIGIGTKIQIIIPGERKKIKEMGERREILSIGR